MRAFAPDGGKEIVGSYDFVPACAGIPQDSFDRDASGEVHHDWTGHTELYWDGQETYRDDSGGPLFQDEDGQPWPMDKLVLCADPECTGPGHAHWEKKP